MSAVQSLVQAKAAGIQLSLRPTGEVQATPTPKPDLLADLRTHKAAIAALLATSTRSPDLPACPRCGGQRFWRSVSSGIVGDWTCVHVPIPASSNSIDILGPVRGEPSVVHCCTRDEIVDAETFAEALFRWGKDIALARVRPIQCHGGDRR